MPDEVSVTDPRLLRFLDALSERLRDKGLPHQSLAQMWVWEESGRLQARISYPV